MFPYQKKLKYERKTSIPLNLMYTIRNNSRNQQTRVKKNKNFRRRTLPPLRRKKESFNVMKENHSKSCGVVYEVDKLIFRRFHYFIPFRLKALSFIGSRERFENVDLILKNLVRIIPFLKVPQRNDFNLFDFLKNFSDIPNVRKNKSTKVGLPNLKNFKKNVFLKELSDLKFKYESQKRAKQFEEYLSSLYKYAVILDNLRRYKKSIIVYKRIINECNNTCFIKIVSFNCIVVNFIYLYLSTLDKSYLKLGIKYNKKLAEYSYYSNVIKLIVLYNQGIIFSFMNKSINAIISFNGAREITLVLKEEFLSYVCLLNLILLCYKKKKTLVTDNIINGSKIIWTQRDLIVNKLIIAHVCVLQREIDKAVEYYDSIINEKRMGRRKVVLWLKKKLKLYIPYLKSLKMYRKY